MAKTVLHIYSSWTAGGAEKTMLTLAAGLEKKGLRNIIACPGDSYMFSQAKALGLAAYPVVIKGSFDPIGFVKLWRIVQKEKVDILHAHQGKVFWPCIFIKWLKRSTVRVVFHRHAQLPHKFYSRIHYLFCDRVIAISKAVAEGLEKVDKVPKDRIRVVYNGTDLERFNPSVSGEEVRRTFGLGNDIVVGTVAAMNRPKGKGQEYLIEAAQLVRQHYPNVRYLIVGTGPIENDLKALAKKLRVEDRVVFAGYQEEVEKFIAAMDIFCFLSWDTEGFGQVMVEAQGMGKPVIGTSIGGIPETFDNSNTGILIPPQDSELLAQQLTVLIYNADQRRQMGEKAIAFARENFSLDKMVDNVINVYNELEVR